MIAINLSKQEISAFTPDDVAKLAQRLEEDDYATPFEALDDWHLLRAIAFQREELAKPYLYLLDIETCDEA